MRLLIFLSSPVLLGVSCALPVEGESQLERGVDHDDYRQVWSSRQVQTVQTVEKSPVSHLSTSQVSRHQEYVEGLCLYQLCVVQPVIFQLTGNETGIE